MHGSVERCIQSFVRKAWRDHSEDLSIGGKITLEWILREIRWDVWTGFVWLRIGTSGELL
jgi:hypothetical protein